MVPATNGLVDNSMNDLSSMLAESQDSTPSLNDNNFIWDLVSTVIQVACSSSSSSSSYNLFTTPLSRRA